MGRKGDLHVFTPERPSAALDRVATRAESAGDGVPLNWHLRLRNVGRCGECGARVALPCRACAARALLAGRRARVTDPNPNPNPNPAP